MNTNGECAERMAKAYLMTQGLQYVASNYQCRAGEIDLIFRQDQQLIFVEVKNRKNHAFGSPLESVTTNKQKKIILAAKHFLVSHNEPSTTLVRFDVIGITNLQPQSIEWIDNAFQLNL